MKILSQGITETNSLVITVAFAGTGEKDGERDKH